MCSYISTVALSQEPMPPAQPAEASSRAEMVWALWALVMFGKNKHK